MVESPHLRRWWALVLAAAVVAAVLAYVSAGLTVLSGHWRWAARIALITLPLYVSLALWPAARLAPQVSRSQRLTGWAAGIVLATVLVIWMTVESRALGRS